MTAFDGVSPNKGAVLTNRKHCKGELTAKKSNDVSYKNNPLLNLSYTETRFSYFSKYKLEHWQAVCKHHDLKFSNKPILHSLS